MKFTLSKTALETALATVSKGVGTNTTLPILAGVYMRAADGMLELQSTNLSVSIRHKVAANVEEPGATIVSGRMITNIVKNLPDAAVTFEGGERTVSVSCHKSSYRLNTTDAENWAAFPDLALTTMVELPSKTLSRMVDKVYRATSKDSTRPVYQGIHLTIKNNMVRVVASDMLRLAFCETTVPVVQDGDFEAIVPGDAFHDVMALCQGEETIRLGIAENQMVFSFGNTTFISRKVEGTFPNPEQLIPASCQTRLEMDVEDVRSALKRVSVIAQTNPKVRFDIDVEAGTLRLQANTPEQGESFETVSINAQGMPITTAFNYHYVFDCINTISEQTSVSLEMNGPESPGIFRAGGDINYIYVLMPTKY